MAEREVRTRVRVTREGDAGAVNDLANDIRRAGTEAKTASVGIGAFTKRFLGISAAVAAIKGVVGIIAEFGAKVAELQAVSGASAAEMKAFTAVALDLGKQTKFTAQQVAEAGTELARAGFDIKQVAASLPGVLDLAAASATDLATSADIASNVLSAFGLAVAEASRVADVLAGASAKSNTTVGTLGESLKEVGPVARAAGVSLEETVAALGALGNAGIKGGAAGNALKAILIALVSEGSEKAKASLRDLGLSMEELDPKANSLEEIITKLADAGIGLGEASDIFGRKGAAAILALTGQVPQLGTLNEELLKVDGISRQMAETMQNTLAGSIDKLKAAFQGVILEAGEGGLSGALKTIVDSMTAVIEHADDVVDAIAAVTNGFLALVTVPFDRDLGEAFLDKANEALQRIADRSLPAARALAAVGDAGAKAAPDVEQLGGAGDEAARGLGSASDAATKLAEKLLQELGPGVESAVVPLETAVAAINQVISKIGDPANLSAEKLSRLRAEIQAVSDRMIAASETGVVEFSEGFLAAAAAVDVFIPPMNIAGQSMNLAAEEATKAAEGIAKVDDAAADPVGLDDLREALGKTSDAAGEAEKEFEPLAEEATKLAEGQKEGASAAADQAASLDEVKRAAEEIAGKLTELLAQLQSFDATPIVTGLDSVVSALQRVERQAIATDAALDAINDESGGGAVASPGLSVTDEAA